MDVSYSVWRDTAAERLELEGDSFSFLFDRRYSNRLNRMSRVFFEAYAKATLEVSVEEDRFPSLSEIESRMESGAIYAYKDRLMRSTGFFEEVKISGISYLIPRARRFVDKSGTYTDLILNLERGEVILPRREKPSAAVPRPGEETTEALAEDADPFGEETSPDEEPIAPVGAEEVRAEEADAGGKEEPRPLEEPAPNDKLPEDVPRGFEAPTREETPAGAPAEIEAGEAPPDKSGEIVESQRGGEAKEPSVKEGSFEETAFVDATVPIEAAAPKVAARPPAAKRPSPPHAPEPKGGKGLPGWGRGHKGPILALAGGAMVILMAALLLFWPSGPDIPAQPSEFVSYSAYLTNSSGSTYLNLDVTNPKGLESRVELVLPPDVDRSISATGGIVTISYTNTTVIQLASRNNASVSVALNDEYILVPVTFNVAVPMDYDSSVIVYDKDYQVSRTNSTISLLCNCTEERLEFDQIYNAKKVIGGLGPQAGGPANATDGPPTGTPGPQP